MANIKCLTAEVADKLKELARTGKINISKMYEMTSAERRDIFKNVVDEETARFVNGKFEEAMISTDQNALKKWAETTFNVREKKSAGYSDLLKKIDNLKEMGVLDSKDSDSFLEDVVAAKLGATVTAEEAKIINEKAKKLETLGNGLDRIGDPNANPEGQMEYFKARKEMEDYLESLNPSSKLRVLTSTIARGNMLFRAASILVNINSNNIEGAIGTIVRRINERTVKADNTKEIGKFVKFNYKIFSETGYDLSRMDSISSEKKILGEEMSTSEGPGTVRKIGRWYEDYVFNATQGAPDVVAASFAFGDRATIMATRIARHEGLKGEAAQKRSLEITNDAMLVEPKTKEGIEVRKISKTDAQRSTNTDKRILAEKGLAFRKLLNVGDLRFGDMNIPFVKTTANAIQSSLQLSGITLPVETIINTVKMVKLVQGGHGWGEASKEAFSGFGDSVTRAGIGILAAYLIANAVDKDDYVGVYPTTEKERELFRIKNAVANSIRIGNRYWSLDWFGPVAAPLIGFLNAKKYGTDLPTFAYFYSTGAAYQILKTPGIDYARQSLDALTKMLTSVKSTVPTDVVKDIANYVVDFTKSRFIPGFAQTIAELTDNVVRDTSTKRDILAPLKSIIPGLRQTLPEKKTVFGDTTETEGINSVIFGGRQKTARDSELIKELSRLQTTGNLPSITDIEKASQRARDLKIQIGEAKFAKAKDYYGKTLKEKINVAIKNPKYLSSSDEEKKAIIEKIRNDVLVSMLQVAGYRKTKKK